MHPSKIFETPLWIIPGEVPKGMYKWTKEYQKNNNSNQISNRGGYQSPMSKAVNDIPFKYSNYLIDKLHFLPKFKITTWWLNINYKGNYNIAHTHPMSDLVVIWYMTDNHGLLKLRDPFGHERFNMYEKFKISDVKNPDVSAGDIVIFPADIEHEVEPHEFSKPRICLSFNLNLN